MNRMMRIIMGVMIITTSLNGAAQTDVNRVFDKVSGRTTISPKKVMKFRSPVNPKDTIYLSVLIDSLNTETWVPYLYTWYPKNVNVTGNLLIGFPNSGIEVFKRAHVESVDNAYNYVEYWMTREQKDKLKYKLYDYIGFEKVAQCYAVKEPTFFAHFLENY